jgi:hypothetical protein
MCVVILDPRDYGEALNRSKWPFERGKWLRPGLRGLLNGEYVFWNRTSGNKSLCSLVSNITLRFDSSSPLSLISLVYTLLS